MGDQILSVLSPLTAPAPSDYVTEVETLVMYLLMYVLFIYLLETPYLILLLSAYFIPTLLCVTFK